MPSADLPAWRTGVDRVGPWRALAVLAALLGVEAGILAVCFGRSLWELDNKKWVAFAVMFMLAGCWSHIEQHQAEYRQRRISWPLVAGQIFSFVCSLASLRWMLSGASPTSLGDTGSWGVALAPLVAWFVASLSIVVPRFTLARNLLGISGVCALFAAVAWRSGELSQSFWNISGETTMQMVEGLLKPFAGGPVIRPKPFVIGTEDFQVTILEWCSGFQGIGLITMLLTAYLWWFRRIHRFPQALLLLPIGVALIWLANVVRITALILVGIYISPAIAVDGFHSTAGWIAFVSVGMGLIVASSRIPFFVKPEGLRRGIPVVGSMSQRPAFTAGAGAGDQVSTTLPTTACLLPFLALTAITMLAAAFSSGFDILYPVRVVCVAAVLWTLRGAFRWQECQIALLPLAIGAVSFVVWMALTPGTTEASLVLDAKQDPFQLGQPWATLWLLFRVVGSTVTVPIAEELFFRGFVARRSINEDADSVPLGQFTWFSFLVSSVLFGVLHGDAWMAGIVVGMLFAAALYSRRRLFDAVVAHATTNALLSAYVIATESWSQWG
ncbi:MAG: exosortase E/protease, VPEID-CTERM system [Planctomycetota bacterium]